MALFDQPLIQRDDEGRLRLRHGPIDLIVEAFGQPTEVDAAYQQAANAFSTVLTNLVTELAVLRKQQGTHSVAVNGDIAIKMTAVAGMFSANHYITPMIAVAGAVADHVLSKMKLGRVLSKAYVNNGGDIAIYLSGRQQFSIGVCTNLSDSSIVSRAIIDSSSAVRGIATSGWRGRSHSLGIADSVTVLAPTAAIADAAATLIANAIDLPDHPMIERTPASELNPDSDLGDRLVTVDVSALSFEESCRALESGRKLARAMIDAGQITAVYGSLNEQAFTINLDAAACRQMQTVIDQQPDKLACA